MLYYHDVIEAAKNVTDTRDLTHILIFKSKDSNNFAVSYHKDMEQKASAIIFEEEGGVKARDYKIGEEPFDRDKYNLIGLYEVKPK